ncbi:LamG-like jellyroll fold domain-containing protein [Streptomyces sp. NPDC002889]|uniref:LamG-like jellyroll fold domain-containing protein n=1 Tax=Streptomyces sp. NPDC002889 TaxID=3364669 RepID=UPI00369BB5F7
MRSRFAVSTALAAMFSALVVPAVTAEAAVLEANPPARSEEQRALARAAETGERVEVVGARTEFATTYANPDGASFRLEQSVVPVRARTGTGAWVKPDATLERRADGSVGPRAATVDLSFSGGGEGGRLVSIARGGRSLDLGWPGRLPEPVLDGDSAVYPEVLPGVDLRMTATVEGFREVLVVKTPKAAANPALKRIQFSLKSAGVKVSGTAGGGMSATDANAKEVFVSPPALMWDSRGEAAPAPEPVPGRGSAAASPSRTGDAPSVSTPAAKASVPAPAARGSVSVPTAASAPGAPEPIDGPGPGDARADLPIQVAKDSLAVVPDAELLGQKDAQAFPLYIDPQVTWGESERTLLRSDGYESYGWGNGDDGRGMGAGKCGTWNGYYCGPGYVQRLYFEFSPSSLAGKHILDATFRLTEPWAFQCDPRWVDLVRTNNISSATSWSSRPGELDLMVDRHVSAGRGSLCDPDAPDAPIDFNDSADESNENLTPTVRDFAAGKFSRLTLAIRAHDEGDTSAWKRFKNDAVLAVEYVGRPYYPSPFGLIAGKGTVCSKDAAKPSIVSDPTPQLSATLRTYSGGESGAMLKGLFRVEHQSGGSWIKNQDILSPTGTAYVGAGKPVTPTVPTALKEGTLYRVGAWTNSYWNSFRNVLTSGSAGVCYFKVDPTAPKAPVVTAVSGYTLCTTTCVPGGGPNIKGTFSFAPAPGDTITAYQYKQSNQTAWSPEIAGSTVSRDIVPPEPGTYQLEVRAKDNVGRFGASQIVSFLVKEGDGPVGRWHFGEDSGQALDTSTTVVANQDNATLSTGATRDGRGRRGELWYDGKGEPLPAPKADKGMRLNGTSGYAATSGPVLETRSAYTVSTWVRLDDKGVDSIVLSQDGTRYSPFLLWHELTYGKWCFGTKEKDEDTGQAYFGVCGSKQAQLNVWTHLAGTYDPATQSLAFYVNGKLQGTRTVAGSWNAGGGMQIGRYKWNSSYQHYFPGSVDEVAVWQRALSAAEIAKEARTLSSASGLADVELVANWSAAGGSGTTLTDAASGYGRNLTLAGGAALDGQALELDGTDDAATTTGPVLDDTGSFTVTTTVALDREKLLAKDAGYVGQVAGQRTAGGSSWGLWYELTGKETRLDDEDHEYTVPVGYWRFGRVNSDGTHTWVSSDEAADLGSPVRLTGVFDALAEPGGPVIRLYVGLKQNDTERAYTALAGSGDFAVGKGASTTDWGHYLPARVDEVRIWAGAMTGTDQIGAVIGD